MANKFLLTGRTGWYYRILEPGVAGEGDRISLIERTQPVWTVERVTAARLTRSVTAQDAEVLGQMPELAEG